jgi:hypothetical protein
MALISPGVEVTVIDESQYIPSAVNTVPFFLVATAQDKVSGAGVGVAAGTLAANANKTYLITSQRDLAATFGVPFFYQTTTGTPINGYELNEYGLLAAYSALGITNRAYVQRANINLTELTASLNRPVGEPADGTYWLDTSETAWGLQQWSFNTSTFTTVTPIIVSDPADVTAGTWPVTGTPYWIPNASVGSIGDYAVVNTNQEDDINNLIWFKNTQNDWVLLGSQAWQESWPTVYGTNAPASLTVGATMYINDTLITVPASPNNTVAGLVAAINAAAITGVTAEVSTGGYLYLYGNSDATNDGSTGANGIVNIETGPVGGAALLTALGIADGDYNCPEYLVAYNQNFPRWRSSDGSGYRPAGSVWNNISPVNNGLSIKLKKYSTTLGEWVSQTVSAYGGDNQAIAALDPVNGGKTIPVGTVYVEPNAFYWNTEPNSSGSFLLLERAVFGQTVVTGTEVDPTFTVGNTFTIRATAAGSSTYSAAVTATIGGSGTASDFVTAVSAAAVPYVSASIDSAGAIVIVHSQGGSILLDNTAGSPLTDAGFTTATPFCRLWKIDGESLVLSNFVTAPTFSYTSSTTAPDTDPANGRLWYYSTVSEADIMIQNNGAWIGYQNCANDTRGFDLTQTNAKGPLVSATAPTTQNDAAQSPLEYGDLWIDSSDLENYPKLYRWQAVDSVDQWVEIDTTDQVTSNGILFADARWAPNGTTDPIADPIPTIVSLLTSNYLDLDAPDPALYPQGMLLFNTRRSGYNVKSYAVNYFNATSFPDDTLPSEKNTWLSASGLKQNGSMYAGRQAQRQMIVEALKSSIDTSTGPREDTAQYTIIATPGYPELMPNMIALSNERNNTLFVVGDTPMRLAGNANDLVSWATNNNGLGLSTEDGLVTTSNYMATFYPSCTTTDLSGQTVVQPPSHMMMRTIIRSDEVAYPWLAPAGTRRGIVDNALQLGVINSATGEFEPLSVNQALRDVLYENNVNPITFIPGVGITNFGNKTSTTVTSALDRINVARLVAFLRGRLEEIGKLYLFEPNDQITRNEITNTINSLMVDLIAKRAIYDYLVVCDLSNNTPARIDRNELWVDVAIEPVKAVEFIYIPLRIKNTGEIASGA